jgi:LysM repeat protein
MKRLPILLIACLLLATPALRGQDAAAAAAQAEREAAEERYKRLNSAVEDLLAAQTEQQKRIATLAREIENLREQASKPTGNYASQEDLRKLAEKLQEIDKKREADKELILKEIERLGKLITGSPGEKRKKPPSAPAGDAGSSGAPGDKGFEHIIASGDTLSTIAQAFREKGIKITVDQILKANPKLDATKLKIGQKIWIPAPDKP